MPKNDKEHIVTLYTFKNGKIEKQIEKFTTERSAMSWARSETYGREKIAVMVVGPSYVSSWRKGLEWSEIDAREE